MFKRGNVIICIKKKEKKNLIFELNQMNSDKIMDEEAEFDILKTWNSYLNLWLLKIVALLSNHENHLQTIFLPKIIAYFYLIS